MQILKKVPMLSGTMDMHTNSRYKASSIVKEAECFEFHVCLTFQMYKVFLKEGMRHGCSHSLGRANRVLGRRGDRETYFPLVMFFYSFHKKS